MDNVRRNITLSNGRVIVHTRQPNGSQDAIPTPGDYALTYDECREYVAILRCDPREFITH